MIKLRALTCAAALAAVSSAQTVSDSYQSRQLDSGFALQVRLRFPSPGLRSSMPMRASLVRFLRPNSCARTQPTETPATSPHPSRSCSGALGQAHSSR